VDGSWPNLFPGPTAPASEAVSMSVGVDRVGDRVRVSLAADLDEAGALHHVIYSLDYDAASFEYLGAKSGAAVEDWGLFDNPAEHGVAHGIVHRRGGRDPMTGAGEVLVFEFRSLVPEPALEFGFSRLLANDLAVKLTDRPVGPPVPSRFALGSAPNPFNPTARIRLEIPAAAGVVPVVLRIHDITGRLIRTLVQEPRGPGYHDVIWNGVDERGHRVGTGIYMVHVRAGGWSAVKKIALVK
jgi:hypothetical protein